MDIQHFDPLPSNSNTTTNDEEILNSNDTLTDNIRPPRIMSKSLPNSRSFQENTIKSRNYSSANRLSTISDTSTERNFEHQNFVQTPKPNLIDPALLLKRKQIVDEILETESRYVSDLSFLKEQFIMPLTVLTGTSGEIITNKTVHDIFSYHDGILATNREIERRLKVRVANWNESEEMDRVGDIFLNLAPFLRIYSLFLTNFNSSLALVTKLLEKNQKFAHFVKVSSL